MSGKSIIREKYSNSYNSYKPDFTIDANKNKIIKETIEPSRYTIFNIFLFIFVLSILGTIVLAIIYRNEIYNYIINNLEKSIGSSKENDDKIKELENKYNELFEKMEKEKAFIQKISEEKKEKKITEEDYKEQKDKIKEKKIKNHYDKVENDLKSSFKPNQIVKQEGSFCFIGKENDINYCMEVYKGDICTSGSVFETLYKCQNPKAFYRKN